MTLQTELRSSNLVSASYEVWSGTLTIEFHSGAVYEYADVPPVVYDRLISNQSPGSFHHQHISNRYSFRRIK